VRSYGFTLKVRKAASVVVQISLPIVLILLSVWIILVTAKLWAPLEYRLPGFPEDRYGFTLEDRIYWSSVDIAYLLSDAEIAYFDDFILDDGSPMHNARELKHMEDVKQLLQVVWVVLGVAVGLILVTLILLWRSGAKDIAVRTLQRGAIWTVLLMLGIGLTIGLSFGVLFVAFHRIFFEGNTWIFPYSDTFIRLYPERFWRDSFIYIALITLGETGLVFLLSRWLRKRM
jgi:integral membrane protein (TIGR01906 family)